MTFKDIQELLKLIHRLELSEFKLKEGEFELSVRTKHFDKGKAQVVAPLAPITAPAAPLPQQPTYPPPPAPSRQAASPAPAAAEGPDEARYLPVKSPMVGTFYRSSAPEKPPYAKIGDDIKAGEVICIIEAMKLFNEIESEVSGKIVKIMVEDAQPVEYDQVLFLVDPQG